MREISTYVDIDASASLVWHILTDFATYRRWNPTMRTVLGSAERGNTILITQRADAGGAVPQGSNGRSTLRRTVKHVREPRELYWLGTWGSASVFTAERRFRIESLPAGRVRFHQCERLRGVAVPFLWWGLRRKLTPAFRAMNDALKHRAEFAEAQRTNPPQPAQRS
jgi:hypothetical protein